MAGMIEARGLVKVYDTEGLRVEALRGIDLEIERGQMVAIMGPSGCGKTPLLNTMSGIDEVTSGEVIIGGTSIGSLSDKQLTLLRLPVNGVHGDERRLVLGWMNPFTAGGLCTKIRCVLI